jgi:hypothetical protein
MSLLLAGFPSGLNEIHPSSQDICQVGFQEQFRPPDKSKRLTFFALERK